MLFQFHTHITEQDYWDFHVFLMTRSPYGRRLIRVACILFAILGGISVLFTFLNEGFTAESLLAAAWVAMLVAVFALMFVPASLWSAKLQIRYMRKHGKRRYSPSAVLEFYENGFVEITPERRMEQSYTTIERISIVSGKMIYIHINNTMAHLLPLSCFASAEEYARFFAFMQTRCADITVY